MPGFTKYADIVAAQAAGKSFHAEFRKQITSSSSGAVGWWRMWVAPGAPGVGAEPASTPGTSYTNTLGGINFPDAAGMNKYITAMSLTTSDSTNPMGTIMVADRITGVGSLAIAAGTNTVTVNSTTLPRYTGGSGLEAWVEVIASGSGLSVLKLASYTSNGIAGHSGASYTIVGSPFGSRAFQLPLQAGDDGLTSVEQLTVTGAAGGTCNVVLIKPLVFLPFVYRASNYQEFVLRLAALQRIYDGATLALYYLNGHNSTTINGTLQVTYA